jgi:hypothetical protein
MESGLQTHFFFMTPEHNVNIFVLGPAVIKTQTHLNFSPALPCRLQRSSEGPRGERGIVAAGDPRAWKQFGPKPWAQRPSNKHTPQDLTHTPGPGQ